ncbi:MAG: cation transporter [Lachnospiraceae bacterium]
MNKNMKREKLLLNLSLLGSLAAVFFELYMSYATRSQAILMDGIFDTFELIVSCLFVILLPLIYAPISEKMPYGYAQLESVFMMVKGAMLSIIIFALIYENIQILLHGGSSVDSILIAFFEFITGICSMLLLFVLIRLKKGLTSQVANGEITSWKIDVYCCMGVSFAFFAQYFLGKLGYSWIGNYVDPVVAIVIAICMLPQTLKIVLKSLKSIILLSPKEAKVAVIKQAADESFAKSQYRIEFYDMVQTGRKVWVELYITSSNNTLDIKEMKRLREEIEEKIKKHIPECYVEITPKL